VLFACDNNNASPLRHSKRKSTLEGDTSKQN